MNISEKIDHINKGLDALSLDLERTRFDMCKFITQADWEYLQAESSKYPALTLADCRCGCHGDYTEHTMRAGESGRCASIIVVSGF